MNKEQEEQLNNWKEQFEEKFGNFAILGKAGRFYSGGFIDRARISKAQDFISTLLREQRQEIIDEIEEFIKQERIIKTDNTIRLLIDLKNTINSIK